MSRNVAKMVERPSQARHEMKTWTAEQAATFLEAVASDRLGAAFMLSLYGLRRGEVLGLRWSDVDLDAKTITIRMTRVLVVGAGVVEGEPNTERGRRTLPLDDGLAAALRSLRTHKHGTDWQQGRLTPRAVETVVGSIWFVDELGNPYRPQGYGDRFATLTKAAGLPVIRLHDARPTCGTLMQVDRGDGVQPGSRLLRWYRTARCLR